MGVCLGHVAFPGVSVPSLGIELFHPLPSNPPPTTGHCLSSSAPSYTDWDPLPCTFNLVVLSLSDTGRSWQSRAPFPQLDWDFPDASHQRQTSWRLSLLFSKGEGSGWIFTTATPLPLHQLGPCGGGSFLRILDSVTAWWLPIGKTYKSVDPSLGLWLLRAAHSHDSP